MRARAAACHRMIELVMSDDQVIRTLAVSHPNIVYSRVTHL